jgi:threonine/homoserine/homoserine lactone efflux protein
MDLSALLIFAATVALVAGSPGPSIAALLARVIAQGHQGVLPFLAAMWIGEAIWLGFAVFGLAVIAQTFHLAFLAIKYLGLAYLAFLAYKMWTAPVSAEEGELPKAADSSIRLFLTGLAITLGNPKIMVLYMAILPTVIDLAHVSVVGWGELTVTLLVVLAAIDLSYVLLAARARQLIRSSKAMRLANKCSAVAMGGAAIAMATR